VTPALFGAIVTPPITLRPQRGQAPPRLAEVPGGFLLATGDHNPGYRRVAQEHAGLWRRLGIPVLVALAASTPEDWDRLAGHLDEETPAAGLELHLPEGVRGSEVSAWVVAVRRACTLPILVKLPDVQAEELALACVKAGADALVVGVPPRAAYPATESRFLEETEFRWPVDQDGLTLIEAPVAGPIAFPFTLRALKAVVALDLAVPLVAAGGITRPEGVRYCLEAGAVAVQVRSLLWTDPAAVPKLL
jgi:dihydroorotate dehydrogenase (NAD+) catalytic subunit